MKRFFITALSLICIIGCLCMTACTDKYANNNIDGSNEMANEMYIKIGETTLTATLADNSSARALKEILPITIDMSDYANFEKVGNIGTSLPRNDEYITTEPGDLILYMGSRFVIYYAPNTYSFTRLGKINDITQSELRQILGDGDITVVLSLTK